MSAPAMEHITESDIHDDERYIGECEDCGAIAVRRHPTDDAPLCAACLSHYAAA